VYVSVSIFRAIAAELPRFGLRAEDLFASVGLDPAILLQSTGRISMPDAGKFVRKAVALTGMPDLGIRIGATAPTRALQIVGPMLESAPTMRSAIALYQRYGGLIIDGARFDLLESGTIATIRYVPPQISQDFARFVAEVAIAFAHRIALALVGPGESAEVVRFQHARPESVAAYETLFECDLEFETAHNEVVFDARLLDRPQIHIDAPLCGALQRRADEMLAMLDAGTSLEDRVRALLAMEPDLTSLPVDAAAARLGMGSRTFQRRLGREGASWSSLLEEEQKRRACTALERSAEPIKELAYRIGFSEPSAFHRAFKRWTGMTPSEYRRQRQP
jgi:AraC-like DNA-binding protein